MMEIMEDSMLAVIVIYNELIDDSESLNSLDSAFTSSNKLDVLVYDNSKTQQNIEKTKFTNFNFIYIHNPNNPGLGVAYNRGGEMALERNKTWLLLLDQDTVFADDFFDKMKEAIVNNPKIKLFAPILMLSNNLILSPCSFRFFHGKHLKEVHPGINSLLNSQPVNSGIMVSLEAFLLAGGYNEKVKLDYSDHQFIERFKKIEKNYFVLDSIGQQNFSGLEHDLDKILVRFKYFCIGALNFETNRFYDPFLLHFFLILKVIKNTVKHTNSNFFKVYFTEFFNSIKN